MKDPIAKTFGAIVGQPCWGVKAGGGTSLKLEFGQPRLHVREPVSAPDARSRVRKILQRRHVVPVGEWFLWIWECEWTVLEGGRAVGDSSTRARGGRAAEFLSGQKFVSLSLPAKSRAVFSFDLGARLETRAIARKSEMFKLFEPTGKVLTIRADGCYAYHHEDLSPEKVIWKNRTP